MTTGPYLTKIERGNTNYKEFDFWEVEFYTHNHMSREQISRYATDLLSRLGIVATTDYDTRHGSELSHIVPVTSDGELDGDRWTFHCKVVAATSKENEDV